MIGLCNPANIRRNCGARPGDALILTKGIGVGIYSAAFKKQVLPEDAYAEIAPAHLVEAASRQHA